MSAPSERGIDFTVKRTDGMAGWISARTHHEECAFAKVLIGRDNLIVGAHLVGHGAEGDHPPVRDGDALPDQRARSSPPATPRIRRSRRM